MFIYIFRITDASQLHRMFQPKSTLPHNYINYMIFTIGDAAPHHSLYGVCCSDVECYFISLLILLSMSYFIMVITYISETRIYMAIYLKFWN